MRPPRRAYLDWLRGLAVLCMIEWHVLDAWTAMSARGGWHWAAITAIGGLAAPLFLFLAGIAVPLAIASRVGQGASRARAAWFVQRRGWEIFVLAHLFRFQSFLLNPIATWSSVFKPDILNILGLGIAWTAWLSGRGSARGRRVWWWLVPVAAVLVLTPLSRQWWWPTLLHPRLEAYIRPTPFGTFALFPWAAYLPAGAFVGALIAQPGRDERAERRLHRWFAIGGLTAAAVGVVLAALALPPALAPWAAVWGRFLRFAGGMTALVWVAWVWWRLPAAGRISAPLLLFGRTSLFVYWVHVELAYGIVSYPLHHALPLWLSIAGFAGLTIVMWAAAEWWARRPAGPWIPAGLRAAST